MPLSRLATVARRCVHGVERRGEAAVTDVTEDSRAVRAGWLFAAVPGTRRDGHDLAADAVRRGAAALLVQRFVDLPVPQLRVGSTRAALGPLAATLHDEPSRRLSLVGITGTNGKTTLGYLLAAACEAGGVPTGLIGTVESRIGAHARPSMLTTPAAPTLQRTLSEMRDDGAAAVVMEVSSHALDQHRVAGCRFALSLFTNLEPEHLDYHGTMAQYYASKARLFTPHYSDRALICTDGDWGRRLAAQTTVPSATFGRHAGADVRFRTRSRGLDGIEVDVLEPGGSTTLASALVGAHNGANIAGAFLAARSLGVDPAAAAAGIAACPRPPGRFELVDEGQPFLVIVDYAHTPRSLALLLATARGLLPAGGRVLLVVGARGGRDRYKRPETARAAAAADWAVVTTDNPGDEEPSAIVAQLRAGLLGVDADHVRFEPDRAAAIAMAVAAAHAGDAVVIAGRGHESTVRMGDLVLTLDDRRAAAAALRHREPVDRPAGRRP